MRPGIKPASWWVLVRLVSAVPQQELLAILKFSREREPLGYIQTPHPPSHLKSPSLVYQSQGVTLTSCLNGKSGKVAIIISLPLYLVIQGKLVLYHKSPVHLPSVLVEITEISPCLIFFFFFLFPFLGQLPQHMLIPRLGVKSEL